MSVVSAVPAADGEGQGGAGRLQQVSPRVDIPVLDIRANIMRRLREGAEPEWEEPSAPQTGSEPAANGRPQGPAAPAVPAPEPPGEPAMVEPEKAPEPAPVESRETTQPALAPEARAESGRVDAEKQGANHVPVPEKTLTIRQIRDVDRLADELERARRNKENGGG